VVGFVIPTLFLSENNDKSKVVYKPKPKEKKPESKPYDDGDKPPPSKPPPKPTGDEPIPGIS
jgi:hypothetical protein